MDSESTLVRPRPGKRRKQGDNVSAGSALGSDEDITVIRPRPGGTRNPHVSQENIPDVTNIRPRRGRRNAPMALTTINGFGRSSLIDASATLLSLVSQLRGLEGQIDVSTLHRQIVQQVRLYSQKLEKMGIAKKTALQARYVMCALIDETVLNSVWGEYSIWSQKSLLSVFHKETYGGEKFYIIVDKAIDAPRKDYELLELLYLCLSLGFMGKMRIDPQGAVKCERVRTDIYTVLHNAKDDYAKELSINIKPSGGLKQRLHSFLPVWVYSTLLGLIAFGLFTFLLLSLNKSSDLLQADLAALTPTPKEPVLSVNYVRPEVIKLRELLSAEIEHLVLRVDDYQSRVSIVLQAAELFGSGSTEVNSAFYPILDKISKALEVVDTDGKGRIIVSGHTDSNSIRTPRYPSNWHLSLARASEIVKYMSLSASLKGRLLPEGKADTEPVASNVTVEGRAKNRRVVIDIYYPDKI